MNSNLLVLPILLPLLCALVLVFTKEKNRLSKILYIGTMSVNTVISLCLLIYVLQHKPIRCCPTTKIKRDGFMLQDVYQ